MTLAKGILLAALASSALSITQAYIYQYPLTAASHLSIPTLGFGTWNLGGSNVSEAVSLALEVGYRHIDCAKAYNNEEDVGRGIADGLKKVGLDRSDIWVTSKLWNEQ